MKMTRKKTKNLTRNKAFDCYYNPFETIFDENKKKFKSE